MVRAFPSQPPSSNSRIGPISTVSVLGQRLIILNDARLAFELLEKKSVIYSDRPKLPFASLYASPPRQALLAA